MKKDSDAQLPLAIKTALKVLAAIEAGGLSNERASDIRLLGKIYFITGGVKGMRKARRQILDLGPHRSARSAILEASWNDFAPGWREKAKKRRSKGDGAGWLCAPENVLLPGPEEVRPLQILTPGVWSSK